MLPVDKSDNHKVDQIAITIHANTDITPVTAIHHTTIKVQFIIKLVFNILNNTFQCSKLPTEHEVSFKVFQFHGTPHLPKLKTMTAQIKTHRTNKTFTVAITVLLTSERNRKLRSPQTGEPQQLSSLLWQVPFQLLIGSYALPTKINKPVPAAIHPRR
jgi:hypothetical protein